MWQKVQIATNALDAGGGVAGVRGTLETAAELANRCLTDTRRTLLDLRAEALDRAGLASAVEAMAAQVRSLGAINPTVTIIGTPRPLESRVEQNILRVAQEAVNNAVKHSGAKSLAIVLEFHAARVEVLVSDDGSGPPSLTDSGPQNLGLLGIRERAREIGATVAVTGARGRGTMVHLVVPDSDRERRPTLASRIATWITGGSTS